MYLKFYLYSISYSSSSHIEDPPFCIDSDSTPSKYSLPRSLSVLTPTPEAASNVESGSNVIISIRGLMYFFISYFVFIY